MNWTPCRICTARICREQNEETENRRLHYVYVDTKRPCIQTGQVLTGGRLRPCHTWPDRPYTYIRIQTYILSGGEITSPAENLAGHKKNTKRTLTKNNRDRV